jgi:DNA-binding response OmpR family regulator
LIGAHRVQPDLIILDVNMPSGNGFSVCEMLAGDNQLSKIPVLIMTGQSDDETQRRCEKLGARYVVKGAGLWERLEPIICDILKLQPEHLEVEAAPEPLPSEEAAPAPPRPKIVCIDDDPEISKLVKLRLEPLGIDVVRAFSGMQGYWTCLDTKPRVIITDLSMPDGEGNYLVHRLKFNPATESIPILVLTGRDNPAVRRQMLSLGADGFLTKPLVMSELLTQLRRHMDLPAQPKLAEV